jgi:CheY-like chemotaxis protein
MAGFCRRPLREPADMLSEMGFSVVEADSAERALQLLSGGVSVDVLITDHLMPGMTLSFNDTNLDAVSPIEDASFVIAGAAD